MNGGGNHLSITWCNLGAIHYIDKSLHERSLGRSVQTLFAFILFSNNS